MASSVTTYFWLVHFDKKANDANVMSADAGDLSRPKRRQPRIPAQGPFMAVLHRDNYATHSVKFESPREQSDDDQLFRGTQAERIRVMDFHGSQDSARDWMTSDRWKDLVSQGAHYAELHSFEASSIAHGHAD